MTKIIMLFCLACSVKCCSMPPSLWCLDEKMAKHCGVVDQCNRYRRIVYNRPVKLTLLYESLCGACAGMVIKVLPALYETFSSKYLKIELVPFGNTQIWPNGTMTCPRGSVECMLNKFEGCAIHYIKPAHVQFIRCFELVLMNRASFQVAREFCYKNSSVTAPIERKIQKCTTGKLGSHLQLKAAKRTGTVKPDRQSWVPWLMINNYSIKQLSSILARALHQSESFNTTIGALQTLICLTYEGTDLPHVCKPLFEQFIGIPR